MEFVSRAILLGMMIGCARQPPLLPYSPMSEVEAKYGKLITAANRPTPNRRGTGGRVGMFLDASGTVWGLPLSAGEDGALLACAPPGLHDAKITDHFPAGWTIVGATNEPTGWRGGTGALELIFRDSAGAFSSREVLAATLPSESACSTPQPLQYYSNP